MDLKSNQTQLINLSNQLSILIKNREKKFNELEFNDSLMDEWFCYTKRTEKLKKLLGRFDALIMEYDQFIDESTLDPSLGTDKGE